MGLGNIWRFPYITGVNGGGAFVLIYAACIAIIAVPLLSAEIAMGRRGGGSGVATLRRLAAEENRSPLWQIVGWLFVLTPTVGLMYYGVVAGWTLDYVVTAMNGAFRGVDADGSAGVFGAMTGNPWRMLFWHALFLGLTTLIVTAGVQKGLERAVKGLMPCLTVLLLVLVVYAALTADFAGALRFLFTPDFSKVTPAIVLMAIGQAFFSVNVATGSFITYSAYMPRNISIPRSAATIAVADTGVALLTGLVIFPLVLTYGLVPGEGPGLVFVTLPIAFGQMPGGAVFGSLFFLLMGVAALTSSIGMLEPIVSWLEEHRGVRRRTVALFAGIAVWLSGIPVLLSFNVWSEVTFAGSTIFGLFDFVTANIFIPVGGLLIALFAGWMMTSASLQDELQIPNPLWFRGWRLLVRFLAPVALVLVFLANLA